MIRILKPEYFRPWVSACALKKQYEHISKEMSSTGLQGSFPVVYCKKIFSVADAIT